MFDSVQTHFDKRRRVRLCRCVSLIMILFIVGSAYPASAADTEAHNWYVMGNDIHSKPLLGADQKFISDYDAVYLNDNCGEEKVVYLTFDAGYENGNVAKILDALKEHNAHGAFFVLEHLIRAEPDLVRRMKDEGHLVCNHTASHRDMTEVHDEGSFCAELEKLESAYREVIGGEMAKFFRPPEGRYSAENLKFATDHGYTTVFWSFAYADWDNAKQPDREKALKKILLHIHPGEIMLLHPTSSCNAAILGDLLTELENQGYRFGSLDELKGV